MFKFFKKDKGTTKKDVPNIEVELTASILAYEIARADGEVSNDELSIILKEIKKLTIKVGKSEEEILKIIEINLSAETQTNRRKMTKIGFQDLRLYFSLP